MTTRFLSPTRTPAVPSCSSALPVILTGTFMVVLDFFIVNVALPSMQAGLHAPASTLEWVAAGYALTSAVFLISSGRLGDISAADACSPTACCCSPSAPRSAASRTRPSS